MISGFYILNLIALFFLARSQKKTVFTLAILTLILLLLFLFLHQGSHAEIRL